MEVMQVLHMNNGEGETSYAKNSNIQRKIILATNSRLKEAILNIMCNNKKVPESIGVADLGCSSGPNTLMVVREIIDFIDVTCRKSGSSFPELRISLNDLPGSDFNDIFRSLPAFFQQVKEEKGAENCYVVGVPGSFYGRLFPRKSLHFVHSSSSLHWLSQVPLGLATNARSAQNKGKLYISTTSSSDVINAYVSQFQNDFRSFLRCRSPEMVPGGRMLLSLMGRSSIDPSIEDGCYYQWELLAHALSALASKVLHMNNGEGETSYAKNSNIQRKIISTTNSRLKEAILNIMCSNKKVPESIGVADLGCSSGPNTLMVVTEIIDIVNEKCRKSGSSFPELRISLNDLPGNDFNDIFRSLPAFFQKVKEEKGAENCYVVGVPGSFYERLFPLKSLHFVHSSSSLHWLSQVPLGLGSDARSTTLNKGKLYISQTSPSEVINAYVSQFQNDFSLFLRCRSPEMVPGGRMLLSLMGRSSTDPTIEDGCYYQWELLANALSTLVLQGLVEEEKIDSFNAPYYAPCPEELKIAVEKEGSFMINRIEAFEIEWDASVSSNSSAQCEDKELLSRGQQVAKTIRAVVESMVENHFGNEIMDDLFSVYSDLVDDYIYKKRAVYVNLVVSLTRKD